MLALFAIRFFVDQIILGVVLNLLASAGSPATSYDRLLVPHPNTCNTATTFSAIKIPVLGNIPIIGPIFFDSSIFLYITYALIIVVQVGLFQHPLGPAGPRGRRAPDRGRHGRHQGARPLRYRNVVHGRHARRDRRRLR